MALSKKIEKKYTYGEYLTWPEDERYEIIEGIIYNMTPAPDRNHQKLVGNFFYYIKDYLKDKLCEVYISPFDVRLPSGNKNEDKISTVVQPDISVICSKKKLDDRGCLGAPDLVIEIISPSTVSRDMKIKLDLYEKHGVKEYWIVDPELKTVIVFKQASKKGYGRPQVYADEDKIKVGVIKGLVIDLGLVFSG